MIPSMLDEVDHIVFLPRVASHILAGNSLGLKLGVGFLRGDSRGEFHNGGKHFYAMYEEINHIPAILNHLTRLGGRPAGIHIREINQHPDNSVMAYLKNQINI